MASLPRLVCLSVLSALIVRPASAAHSIAVKDLVPGDGVPKFEGPTLPVPELNAVSIGAVDVFDDPSAADEIHLPPDDKWVLLDARAVITSGIQRCHGLLTAARSRTSGTWNSIFSNVQSEFSGSTIRWTEPGYDFKACSGNTLAFVIRGRDDIHVCSAVLYGNLRQFSEPKPLGQIFIHEAAHLEGYWDECEASRVEVNGMKASGEGIAFRNGYLDRCGIVP